MVQYPDIHILKSEYPLPVAPAATKTNIQRTSHYTVTIPKIAASPRTVVYETPLYCVTMAAVHMCPKYLKVP